MCLDIHMFTYSLSTHVSYRSWVKCYGMADEVPSPMGRHFIDMVQKSFFAVCILLYLPKNIFQHHEFCGNCKPYQMYLPLSLLYTFTCIHAYICLHFDIFTYFLSGNAWNRLWMKRYGMTDQPPHILTGGLQ